MFAGKIGMAIIQYIHTFNHVVNDEFIKIMYGNIKWKKLRPRPN